MRFFAYLWSQGNIEGVDACQSKVSNLEVSAAADQEVLWLQVTVHHVVGVQEVQATKQLQHQIL